MLLNLIGASSISALSGVIHAAPHSPYVRFVHPHYQSVGQRPSSRKAAAPSDESTDTGLTNRPTFAAPAMELPQQELQALGRTVAGTFNRLVEAQWTDDQDTTIPSKRRIAAEEERFRLWARTLGLFQTGHASLDYRVRDASFIKATLTDLLLELQDHVQNCR